MKTTAGGRVFSEKRVWTGCKVSACLTSEGDFMFVFTSGSPFSQAVMASPARIPYPLSCLYIELLSLYFLSLFLCWAPHGTSELSSDPDMFWPPDLSGASGCTTFFFFRGSYYMQTTICRWPHMVCLKIHVMRTYEFHLMTMKTAMNCFMSKSSSVKSW